MRQYKNTISDRALDKIIRESIDEAIFTDEFKDKAKRFGKKAARGVGKAALYGSLATAGMYGIDRGLENEYQRQQQINRDAAMMNNGDDEDVAKYLKDHNLEDNAYNRRQADEYYEDMRNDYFKNRDMDESYSRRNKSFISEGLINPMKVIQYIKENIHNPSDPVRLYRACESLTAWVDKQYNIHDQHNVINDIDASYYKD